MRRSRGRTPSTRSSPTRYPGAFQEKSAAPRPAPERDTSPRWYCLRASSSSTAEADPPPPPGNRRIDPVQAVPGPRQEGWRTPTGLRTAECGRALSRGRSRCRSAAVRRIERFLFRSEHRPTTPCEPPLNGVPHAAARQARTPRTRSSSKVRGKSHGAPSQADPDGNVGRCLPESRRERLEDARKVELQPCIRETESDGRTRRRGVGVHIPRAREE